MPSEQSWKMFESEEARCIAVEGGQRCLGFGYFQAESGSGVWCDEHVPNGIPVAVGTLDTAVSLMAQALVSVEGHPSLALANVEMAMTLLKVSTRYSKLEAGYDFREIQGELIHALDYVRSARESLIAPFGRSHVGYGITHAGFCLAAVHCALRSF